MEHNNVLFFIPDISGFTKFIAETEISHSQHIIKELLETLVDANSLGLKVSEFEGDAILFYRQGSPPSLKEFIAQAKKMFINFHTRLKRYELYRLCQCGACKGATDLTLKIVAHFGPAATMQVKDHTKFIGKDIIVAHRLLKNAIPDREYFLMTDDLLHSVANANGDLALFLNGSDSYDEIGNVPYKFMPLGQYREEVHVEPPPLFELKNPAKVMELSAQLDIPMESLFQMLIDLPLRKEWMHGVKEVRVNDGKPNHLGTVHRCVRGKGDSDMVTSDVKATETAMAFWETDVKKMAACRFALGKISDRSTKLLLEFFVRGNPLMKMMFKMMMEKKLRENIEKSLENLRLRFARPA
jgi:carbon monoxide dehydrogenase subunit G